MTRAARPARGASMARDVQRVSMLALERYDARAWPAPQYAADPYTFAWTFLAYEMWSMQRTIAQLVCENERTAFSSGHRIGKALYVDTPIPTPDGWTTMGEIKVGDTVFSDEGVPTRVTFVSEIRVDRECYDVEFSDGTTVTCDADHEWVTERFRDRKERKRRNGRGTPRIEIGPARRTTREISASVSVRNGDKTTLNHTVAVAGSLQCKRRELPVDPYVLGVWLGDGTSRSGDVTTADPEILSELARRGFVARVRPHGNSGRADTYALWGEDGVSLRRRLSPLGVIGNKHVPAVYLRASEAQRRDLLAGLLDTDGSVTPGGHIEFCNTKKRLAEAVFELAASLGLRPRMVESRATLAGEDCGPRWRVHFTSPSNVFRLPRKAKCSVARAPYWGHGRRAIVRVTPRPSVPVRCIQVDAPSHLYLCSKALIPTHNTDLLALLAIHFFCCYRDARVLLLGPTTKQIDGAVYRAVRRLLGQSGRCVPCHALHLKGQDVPRPCPHSALIPCEISTSSEHGVKSMNDLREIRGINVRSEEAAQGIAGENILILADEASGDYLDKILGAMTGNRAGGARWCMMGNPLKLIGEFASAFGAGGVDKSDYYVTRRISSEESPNVTGERRVPGLATREWIEEQIAVYGGRESPFFRMRVLGEHVKSAEGAIFPVELLEASVSAWKDLRMPDTGEHYEDPTGPLVISIDPAESPDGDNAGFMVRRGNDVLELYGRRGISAEGHVVEALGLIARHRRGDEIVAVMVDTAGDVGARARGAFVAHREAHPESWKVFETHFVMSGQRAQREPLRYLQVRDEMAAACLTWLQDGGCIPDHAKLKVELSYYAWLPQASGKAKATGKDGRDGLREKLGRSPTYADLLMLSTWCRAEAALPATTSSEPRNEREALDRMQRPAVREAPEPISQMRSESVNIFRSLDPFRGR